MKRFSLFILAIAMFIALSACNTDEPRTSEEDREVNLGVKEEEKVEIPVQLKNTEGAVVGTAVLSEESDGVHIAIDATHLPLGVHGFHIHEKGMCEEPDFESAGGHFNPEGKEHGFDNPKGPHAGDLPNIEVGEDGAVKTEVVADMVTLEKGKENSLLHEGGTSLVIHADPDDYVSQPAGNAGERIVCGVISE